MKPIDAIQAATVNAADLLGWAGKVGVLDTGHSADIIAVTGDPLSNVRVLESVKFVRKGGVVVRNDTASKGPQIVCFNESGPAIASPLSSPLCEL